MNGLDPEAREYLDGLIERAVARTTDPQVARDEITQALFANFTLGSHVELRILRHGAQGWLLGEIANAYKQETVPAKTPSGMLVLVPSRLAAKVADPKTGQKRTHYLKWGRQLTFEQFQPFAAHWQARTDKTVAENTLIQYIRDVYARYESASSAYEAFRVAGLAWPLED